MTARLFACCQHCRCPDGLRLGHDEPCGRDWCRASRPDDAQAHGQMRLGGDT